MNSARVLNSVWTWRCRRAAKAFLHATHHVAQTQSRVLAEILHEGERSDYGRHYGFFRTLEVCDYQRMVPITGYDELLPWIDQAARGRQHVLTRSRMRLFQPTSGSTGGEKLVPYTDLLKRQFHEAIQAWIWDLYTAIPAVTRGRAYWSISPGAQAPRRTLADIPIGFEHDVEYLGPVTQRLVSRLMAVPNAVARLQDPRNFQYATLCFLLACDDLALISVWSPTFLLVLISQLDFWWESICRDIDRGTIILPSNSEESTLRMRRNPARARQLREIMRSPFELATRLQAIWPSLALISCWCDGASALYRPQLEATFPHVQVQPKGLIATEGIVSIPLAGVHGAALAVNSHFFEFLPVDDTVSHSSVERPQLAHELECGRRYEVLLTTGGGLYRYRLGDTVEVVGFVNQCPLVRFVGRVAGYTDIVGEKLAESHVRSVLADVFAELRLVSHFAMLAPTHGDRPGYRLFLECDGLDSGTQREVTRRVERGLNKNPSYRYAVALGQLRPVQLSLLHGPLGIGWQVFQREFEARGLKAGDIKPLACDGRCDWNQRFAAWTEPSMSSTVERVGVPVDMAERQLPCAVDTNGGQYR